LGSRSNGDGRAADTNGNDGFDDDANQAQDAFGLGFIRVLDLFAAQRLFLGLALLSSKIKLKRIKKSRRRGAVWQRLLLTDCMYHRGQERRLQRGQKRLR
jgi:hypothetical protein